MTAHALPALSEDPLEERRAHARLRAEIGAAFSHLGRDTALTAWRCCPACGADTPSSKPLLRGTVYDFHRCERCSLVYTPRVLHDDFVRSRFTDSSLGRSYRRAQAHATEGFDPESHALALDKVLDVIPSRGAAIDVGSPFGSMAAALKPRFDESFGVDADARTAEIATRRHGVAMKTTTLDELVREDASVDAITFHGVFDGIAEAGRLLRAAHRLLRSGGALYIGVTNGESVGVGFLGAKHPAVATHQTLNLFTGKALETLARRHGFTVRSLGTSDELDVSAADWALSRLPDATGLALAIDRLACGAAARWHFASRRGRGGTLEMVAQKS